MTLDRLNSLAEQLDQQAVSPDPSPEPRDLLVVPGDLLLVQLGRLPERQGPQPDARRQLRLHANDRARLHVYEVQRRRQQLQNRRNRRHCRGPKCFRGQYSRTELSRTPSLPACSMSEPISSSPTFQKRIQQSFATRKLPDPAVMRLHKPTKSRPKSNVSLCRKRGTTANGHS